MECQVLHTVWWGNSEQVDLVGSRYVVGKGDRYVVGKGDRYVVGNEREVVGKSSRVVGSEFYFNSRLFEALYVSLIL